MIKRLLANEQNRQSFVASMTAADSPNVRAMLVGFNPEDFTNGFDEDIIRREKRIPWTRYPADVPRMSLELIRWIFMCHRISSLDLERWMRVLTRWMPTGGETFLIVCTSGIVEDWLAPVFGQDPVHSRGAAVVEPQGAVAPGGGEGQCRTVRACVRKYFNPGHKSRNKECERLLPLIAAELGYRPKRTTVLWAISRANRTS